MTLTFHQAVEQALLRFRPNVPTAPANTFIFGFITPDESPLSVIISRKSAQSVVGVQDAEYIVVGMRADLVALLDDRQPNRAEIVSRLTIRPAYPFNNYLLSILLNALDLGIPDLDYTPKRLEGFFPFPPRYPVAENRLRLRRYEPMPLPAYEPDQLPQMIAEDHPQWIAMYDKAWQLAFRNLRQPEPESGFIANFIDPAFNANIYMWDSCFMMMFGRYARRVYDFMGTLDNFYAKQHDDGFICREIDSYTGRDLFQSLDPRSTGPNIMAWTEWLHYQHGGDIERLRAIFPVLIGYHRWWKDWRTHPDGSYWTSGWGSGMDNQTRVPRSEYYHQHYTWIDATLQQAISGHTLLLIAQVIGREEFNDELSSELAHLDWIINSQLWDQASAFYYDRAPDGHRSSSKSIGAYWALLWDRIPQNHAEEMIKHLDDSTKFNRPHRVPTTPYDAPDYNPHGGYWLGAVWSPTNYMVLRGLTERGYDDLAHAIALNHVENVAEVFIQTGTLWENYAPEYCLPGRPAGRDFVGWTGVSAITIPLEYLIGIHATNAGTQITWNIRLTERHGVLRYPLGRSNTVDLICERRAHASDVPHLTVVNRVQSFILRVNYSNKSYEVVLGEGEHKLYLG